MLTLVPLRGLRAVRSHPPVDHRSERGRETPKRPVVGGMLLWLFAAACLLALTGEAIRLTYLPVLAVDRLAVPLGLLAGQLLNACFIAVVLGLGVTTRSG